METTKHGFLCARIFNESLDYAIFEAIQRTDNSGHCKLSIIFLTGGKDNREFYRIMDWYLEKHPICECVIVCYPPPTALVCGIAWRNEISFRKGYGKTRRSILITPRAYNELLIPIFVRFPFGYKESPYNGFGYLNAKTKEIIIEKYDWQAIE